MSYVCLLQHMISFAERISFDSILDLLFSGKALLVYAIILLVLIIVIVFTSINNDSRQNTIKIVSSNVKIIFSI